MVKVMSTSRLKRFRPLREVRISQLVELVRSYRIGFNNLIDMRK